MKIKTIAVASFLGLAALPGCTASGQIDPNVVVAGAQAVCGFIPTIASVVALFTSDALVKTAEEAIGIICGAFKSQATAAADSVLKFAPGQSVTFDVTTPNGTKVTIQGQVVAPAKATGG